MAASGTAGAETLRLLGLSDTDKVVIFSVIREDRATAALDALEASLTGEEKTVILSADSELAKLLMGN